MKTVLAFGDSLTWGHDPATATRHATENRWPEVLQAGLGDDATVINEGLRGRHTAYDQTAAACDMNGARHLPMLLHTHAPLDLVIVLLGTNDVFNGYQPWQVTAGLVRIVEVIRHHPTRLPDPVTPKILLLAPPPMVAGSPDPRIAGSVIAASRRLAHAVQYATQETGAPNIDLRPVAEASVLDGVHMDAANTRAIGEHLVQPVRDLLSITS